MQYLHLQTKMAPKSPAWQSFSSDQWQAYQNILYTSAV